MTQRLYYNDAYLTVFDATIVEVTEGGRRVYLDRTALYPTSGGQLFDTGTLGGRRVVDVVDEESRIAHLLAEPLAQTSGSVEGRVDWARRFDHMQQHTGQHLLSAVLEDLYGWKTVSVHFGDETSTLDVDAGAAPRAKLDAAEWRANEVIAENRSVGVSYEDAAAATGLRKATERSGEIRIVTIAELDRSACGGTHVRATGEIGGLLLRRVEQVKQGTRIEFVCGLRAVARARADYASLSGIAASLSCGVDEAAAVVAQRMEAAREGEAARRKLAKELDAYRARERYEATPPDARGVRRVVERRAEGSLDDLKGFAHAVCALPRAAFVGVLAASGRVLVGTSEDSGLVAGTVLKDALAAAGGRGGGSPRMAQGAVAVARAEGVVQAVLNAWDRET
ncbi:MAG: alanyl-tRNA editing protein [Gemmatimonadota bacterium]|nr:alanyl-tRNA editing protein [Gemmatimonadota bacterium]